MLKTDIHARKINLEVGTVLVTLFKWVIKPVLRKASIAGCQYRYIINPPK